MNIKYVFSDVDETLLENLKPVCAENIAAIRKLRDSGRKFVITSGRNPGVTHEVIEQCGFERSDDEYVICCGGALVITTSEKIVYEDPLSRNDFLLLIKYLAGTDFSLVSFTDYDYYHVLCTRVKAEMNQWSHDIMTYEESVAYIDSNRPYKFIVRGDPADLKKMGEMCAKVTDGRISSELSHAEIIDLSNATVSKGRAMLEVCRMTGTDPAQTLAIGDNDNDLSLLNAAAFKACPANAVDNVKRICDYVSPKTSGEGAVADIIDRFIFRN